MTKFKVSHRCGIEWERPLTLLKLLILFLSAQTYFTRNLYTDVHPCAVAEKLRCLEDHFGIRLHSKRRPTANFAVQNRTLCFYGPARNETAALTDKRRAKGHLTTEQSGKTCLDRAYRLFSVISAYLAAALTASAGRASPGHAQKDGERACLHPECREKALASSSHTVWFSLLDKHSECWSMSHPQAAISALSRRPTAQLSLSLFLFLSRSNVQRI